MNLELRTTLLKITAIGALVALAAPASAGVRSATASIVPPAGRISSVPVAQPDKSMRFGGYYALSLSSFGSGSLGGFCSYFTSPSSGLGTWAAVIGSTEYLGTYLIEGKNLRAFGYNGGILDFQAKLKKNGASGGFDYGYATSSEGGVIEDAGTFALTSAGPSICGGEAIPALLRHISVPSHLIPLTAH